MDVVRFDDSLASILPDQAGRSFPQKVRLEAMLSAVSEYSRFRPLRKRFGTGRVYARALAGNNYITVLGGPFNVGDTLLVEPQNPSNTETFVIQDVQVAPVTLINSTPGSILTLSGSLSRDHPVGTYVAPPNPGLQLGQNQEYYALPGDWLYPDQTSFDLAVGERASVKREPGYYDASYAYSNQLSGVGFGGSQNYGFVTAGRYPLVGNPFRNPNSGVANITPQGVLYHFENAEPPFLQVSPVPSGTGKIDFYYFGFHTADTVPYEDQELCQHYARYKCYLAKAGYWGTKLDYGEAGVTESPSANISALMKLAQDALDNWEKYMRRLPFVTSG